MPQALSAEQARRRCDPSLFHCDSTAELEPKLGIIGQQRAINALKFGLSINRAGFNIFVSGPAGTGRTTAIKSFLDMQASKKQTPADWCYVYNFRDPYCPRALQLPAGTGLGLQKDLKRLVTDVQANIARAFASKEYTDRRAEVTEEFNRKREAVFSRLRQKAEDKGFQLQSTGCVP